MHLCLCPFLCVSVSVSVSVCVTVCVCGFSNETVNAWLQMCANTIILCFVVILQLFSSVHGFVDLFLFRFSLQISQEGVDINWRGLTWLDLYQFLLPESLSIIPYNCNLKKRKSLNIIKTEENENISLTHLFTYVLFIVSGKMRWCTKNTIAENKRTTKHTCKAKDGGETKRTVHSWELS